MQLHVLGRHDSLPIQPEKCEGGPFKNGYAEKYKQVVRCPFDKRGYSNHLGFQVRKRLGNSLHERGFGIPLTDKSSIYQDEAFQTAIQAIKIFAFCK
jgi:hypothetical protein